MSDILPQITLAAVQASSVHLDRTATVAKACALIAEAGAKGADLIAFPEGFIPAHPCWFTVRPATDKISLGLSRQLFQNAVVIPSADTDALAQACSDAGITAVVGVCEKRAGTTGTLFNTQLFIGPDGQLLGKHREQVNRYLMHFGLSPAARGRVQASNYVQPTLPGIDEAPAATGFARFTQPAVH